MNHVPETASRPAFFSILLRASPTFGYCSGFCVETLKEALEKYVPPEIFNSDQGSQFTSADFTDVLKDPKVRISMDGGGRWIDNRTIDM